MTTTQQSSRTDCNNSNGHDDEEGLASNHSLAPFNPTCLQAQKTALKLFDLKADDVLFDLGCGDGNFLIHAAMHVKGIRCVGIEWNSMLVARGKKAIDAMADAAVLTADENDDENDGVVLSGNNIKNRIVLHRGDVLQEATASRYATTTTTVTGTYQTITSSSSGCRSTKIGGNDESLSLEEVEASFYSSNRGVAVTTATTGVSLDQMTLLDDATAVFVYLLPKGMAKVKPFLQTVMDRRANEKRPFRVVSYMFRIPGWQPQVVDRSTKADVPLYLYAAG